MDEATNDLIAQLYTRIGMLMEDGSPIALTAGGGKLTDRHDALLELQRIVEAIHKLMQAVVALADTASI